MSPTDHAGGADFDEQVRRCIPAEFNMISAADDSQEAQEALNTSQFELPNPNGKEGGACTSALLQVFYDNAHKLQNLTWVQALKQMRSELKSTGYPQEPQLSSSRRIDGNRPVCIVPKGSGRRRALLIGINYIGQQGELKAPHNDTRNLQDYLVNVMGFDPSQMLVLMDDGEHPSPTRKNIEAGFERLVRYSQPGDVVFVSFSGHGGQVRDTSGDEDDGYDESIIPMDFQTAGQIVDDDILKNLVKPMSVGVHCTLLMDCCHSGTVADLPYKLGADDTLPQLEARFNMETADEIREREAREAKKRMLNSEVQEAPILDEDHAEPLPYNPEDGFIVRPAGRPNEQVHQQSPKKKASQDLPPPPPQCCVII